MTPGPAAGVARPPEIVIEEAWSPSLLQSLAELFAYRSVVVAFASRDVQVKYKQAVLGVAWALLQPLGLLAMFTFFLARAGRLSGGDVPYAASALAALVPWLFLQNAVSAGTQALIQDGALIRKIYFPREAPIIGAIGSTAVEFWVGIGLALVVGPFLGARLAWTAVLVAPLFVLLAGLGVGVSLAFGALNVYYRDVRYILPFGIQLWMFASPVIYPMSAVPARWRTLYAALNPAAGLIDAFRRVLAAGAPPDPLPTALGGAGTVVLAWAGYRLFKRLEPAFADVL